MHIDWRKVRLGIFALLIIIVASAIGQTPLTTGVAGLTALTGDVTASCCGSAAATVAKVHGVTYGASPSTNTVPVVTGTNAVTYEAVPNAALANASTTVNSTTCTLGSSCTVSATGGAPAGYGMWTLTKPTWATWMNQGSSASVSGTNFLSIAATATSGNSLRVLHSACNSGSAWTDWYILYVISGYLSGNPFAGIEVDDGTKLTGVGVNFNGSSSVIASETWATTTSASSSLNADGFNSQPAGTQIWIHVGNSSGTLSYHYSFDGVGTPGGTTGGWRTLTASTSGNLAAVTNCGGFINANNASNTSSVTFLHSSFSSLVAQ